MIRTIFIKEFSSTNLPDKIVWKLPILTENQFRHNDAVVFGENVEFVRESKYDVFNHISYVYLQAKYNIPDENDLKRKEEEGWLDDHSLILSWLIK